MDDQGTPQADGGKTAMPPGKLRTALVWCALLLAAVGVAGAGVLTWRSLQADRVMAQVARSVQAGAALPQAGPLPGPAAPAPSASIAAAQVRAEPPRAQARPAETARVAKPVKRASAPARLAAKQGARRVAAAGQRARKPLPSSSPASVQHRLAICKEKAGEAAAACFARACRSYARNAPICINDEPARRR